MDLCPVCIPSAYVNVAISERVSSSAHRLPGNAARPVDPTVARGREKGVQAWSSQLDDSVRSASARITVLPTPGRP